MINKAIFYAAAVGTMFSCAAAFAQAVSSAAPTPPQPAASAAPTAGSAPPASGDDVIHLHMPVHHAVKRAETAAPAESPTVDTIGADATIAPPSVSPAREAPPPPPPHQAPAKPAGTSHATGQQPAAAIPFSFGEDGEATTPPAGSTPQRTSSSNVYAAPETGTASLPAKPMIPRAPLTPAKSAVTSNRAKADEHAGLEKRGAVLFEKGMSDPSPAQFQGVKVIAGAITTALESGASRVQLEAYGGAPGDKSSDARRLSLKRALAVRQLLIDDGVPSSHIVVRALGGADDKGPNDRVDVFVSS